MSCRGFPYRKLQYLSFLLTGGGDETINGSWLCSSRQPNILQPEYGDVARRCQEDLRRSARKSQTPCCVNPVTPAILINSFTKNYKLTK